jgi:hypothetical protein
VCVTRRTLVLVTCFGLITAAIYATDLTVTRMDMDGGRASRGGPGIHGLRA